MTGLLSRIRTLSLIFAALFASASLVIAAPKFQSSFEEAREKAEVENKPLVVIFSAKWCPPCEQMRRVVYPSKELKRFHDEFVWAYLDTEELENQALMQKYGVLTVPHITVHNLDGLVTSELRGAVGKTQLAQALSEVLSSEE